MSRKKLDNYNIVLINLDGFRQDKVTECKSLKTLSEKNYYFSNMYTSAPYTFASLHSIISGLYPSSNGVNAYYNMFKFKKNEITTMAQMLQNLGYFTSCDIISKSVMSEQGYNEYNLFDEETVDFEKRHSELIQRLAKKDKFFLFLHWTETHKHLVREIIEKYKQEDNDDAFFTSIDKNQKRYDSYIPYCDDYVSSILKAIKESGIEDETIVIFFSDHGTSIGEKKGEKFYGVYVYDYTIQVFCILKIPGSKQQNIQSQCRTIDLFPTIAEIVGFDVKSCLQNVQGKSLFSLIESKPELERDVFVETGGLYGPWPSPKKHNVFCIRSENKKLIFNDTPQSWEFYNLKHDPYEKNNIYDEKLDVVKSLKDKLEKYFKTNNIDINIS